MKKIILVILVLCIVNFGFGYDPIQLSPDFYEKIGKMKDSNGYGPTQYFVKCIKGRFQGEEFLFTPKQTLPDGTEVQWQLEHVQKNTAVLQKCEDILSAHDILNIHLEYLIDEFGAMMNIVWTIYRIVAPG